MNERDEALKELLKYAAGGPADRELKPDLWPKMLRRLGRRARRAPRGGGGCGGPPSPCAGSCSRSPPPPCCTNSETGSRVYEEPHLSACVHGWRDRAPRAGGPWAGRLFGV